MVFNPNFRTSDAEDTQANPLLNYLQHQPPEVLARVAQSVSPDIKQIITHNVQGLVGMLPSDNFDIQITTNRENLAGLLASAMMTGYFLRQMEQRMHLDENLGACASLWSDSATGGQTESD
ncbi:DUF760 domain-containing protein [Kamptonema formosum]|uniref:DUF760 domain-containing protein n=1 Tax=Kamptonema formosum TaxID=331992 RepID=UPI00034B1563|nr:DUF760 domain-containing protein [Oscillatoria sp. PCC 10802]